MCHTKQAFAEGGGLRRGQGANSAAHYTGHYRLVLGNALQDFDGRVLTPKCLREGDIS